MSNELSRRKLLRNGGAGLFAAGAVGLSGCLDSVPVLGGGESNASSPAVQNWLADLSFEDLFDEDELTSQYGSDAEFESSDDPEVDFSYVVPQAVFDNEDELLVYWPLEQESGIRDKTGIPATEAEWQLTQNTTWEWEVTYTQENYYGGTGEFSDTSETRLSTGVLAGSFTVEDVEVALEDWAEGRFSGTEELSSEGEYEEFDLYGVANWGFAVRDDYVLEASADQYSNPLDVLEATIDANFGDGSRLADGDDAGTLFEEYDAGHFGTGELHEPLDEDAGVADWKHGLVGTASSMEVDGETTTLTEVYQYDRERNANADALREHVDANRDVGDEWPTLQDYTVDDAGKALVLTGTVRTRALAF